MSFSGRPETFMTETITNDGFFPDLVVGDFQKLHRVPSSFADDAILHQLRLAVGHINDVLAARQAEWIALGYTTLAQVNAATDGAQLDYYRAAVFNRAKANLLADFQTFSRREIAAEQAREGDAIHGSLLAESYRAVRALLGLQRNINAELL